MDFFVENASDACPCKCRHHYANVLTVFLSTLLKKYFEHFSTLLAWCTVGVLRASVFCYEVLDGCLLAQVKQNHYQNINHALVHLISWVCSVLSMAVYSTVMLTLVSIINSMKNIVAFTVWMHFMLMWCEGWEYPAGVSISSLCTKATCNVNLDLIQK